MSPLTTPKNAGSRSQLSGTDSGIRASVTLAIKACSKSRQRIAEEMSAILGIKVTKLMLNCFTAESKHQHRFPSAWDVPFCQVTGDWRLLEHKALSCGHRFISEREEVLVEIGKLYRRSRNDTARIEALLRGSSAPVISAAETWRSEETDLLYRANRYRGIYSRVARMAGVSRSLVQQVANGQKKSRRIMQALIDEARRIERILAERGQA